MEVAGMELRIVAGTVIQTITKNEVVVYIIGRMYYVAARDIQVIDIVIHIM